MSRTVRLCLAGILVAMTMIPLVEQPRPSMSASAQGSPPPAPFSGDAATRAAASISPTPGTNRERANGIVVGHSYKNDVSRPLRDIKPVHLAVAGPPTAPNNPGIPVTGHKDQPDPVIQRSFGAGAAAMPTPLAGWAGISSQGAGGGGCNCAPPDTNGDVGPNNYIQIVNTAFQIWSKAGVSLYGPANINTVWTGFGGACELRNDGDPVVLYDPLANRWLLSQFTSSAPYDECIAISQTADPTGAWYRYAFALSPTTLVDYPHLGVWPDGYYMSANLFANAATYVGPAPYVFDRAQMLVGQPASVQMFPALGSAANPMLPSDLDGALPPPPGAPNYFLGFGDTLTVYKLHVDWNTPANSTFTPTSSVPVAGFTQLCPTIRDCLAQPGTTQRLDGIGDRLMARLAYRNFGDHEALVANHTVDVGGGQAGVRWYEIRDPGGSPTIYQQGSYAPNADNRWMGSAAMDHNGDLAVGYSVSSASTFPSIRYAGRLASDPLGSLPQGEATLFAGSGVQSGVNRWGDYSNLAVDPTDDCTFWYTNEYNNSSNWF